LAPRRPLPATVKAGLIAPYNSSHNRLATLRFVLDIPLNPDDPSGPMVAQVDRHLENIFDRPAIILWGAHDFVFDGDYYQEWRQRLPQVEAYWFDDAGHYLLEDIPDRIILHIRDFLHKHPL